jgi:hypothetical protein
VGAAARPDADGERQRPLVQEQPLDRPVPQPKGLRGPDAQEHRRAGQGVAHGAARADGAPREHDFLRPDQGEFLHPGGRALGVHLELRRRDVEQRRLRGRPDDEGQVLLGREVDVPGREGRPPHDLDRL